VAIDFFQIGDYRPSSEPTGQPSSMPSTEPTGLPSAQPSSRPTSLPSSQPTTAPSRLSYKRKYKLKRAAAV
jgi:hypothetical protein